MRLHSIQIKMMLPIFILAIILAGLFVLMMLMTTIQKDAMKRQAEHYFEAISAVLNADRDIYQARLAQEKILSHEGTVSQNRAFFEENAQQVLERFHKYREYIADEPELVTPFKSFDQRYDEWMQASQNLLSSSEAGVKLSGEFINLDKKFQIIRNMLDTAGEHLREHTRKIEAIDSSTAKDIERYVESVTEVLNADRDLYQARLAQQKIINGVGDFEKNKAYFEKNAQQALRRFHSYRSYLSSEPELTKPYDDFDAIFNEWFQESKVFLASPQASKKAYLPKHFEFADKKFDEIRGLLDKAGELVRSRARQAEKQMIERINHYQSMAMIIIVIAFLVAASVGYLIPRQLTSHVENMARRIREIAEGDGDLTQRINSQSKDELGDLANEFDGFVERLRTIIRSVQTQSVSLGDMTTSLNDVSEKAGSITHALVSASDMIVSAGNEMSMSNQQMAEVAKNTADEADNSSQLTKQGMDAVRSSNQAIESLADDIGQALTHSNELEKSSEAIASVLEVIRKIAEQTNLLALNAAIEAARAGEQGRGFAVVADEVRTLATRTRESTNEIESMIEQLKANVHESSRSIKTSRSNVDNTIETFKEVAQIFDTLSSSFDKVQGMAEHTSHATQEQSTVAHSITENLLQLKDQTDGVEEVSGLIRTQSLQITELYQELNKHVASFKV